MTSEPEFKWRVVRDRDELEMFYESVMPAVRLVSRNLGYAIGEHGSKRRDLDLIAVPWIESAAGKETLVRAIHRVITGIEMTDYAWEDKPCGRSATSFPICFPEFTPHCGEPNLCHLDLSIVDLRKLA